MASIQFKYSELNFCEEAWYDFFISMVNVVTSSTDHFVFSFYDCAKLWNDAYIINRQTDICVCM